MSADPALQRLTWRTWLLWVFVCAVIPALNAVLATAANKNVLRTDPDAALIAKLLWLTMFVNILLPRVLEWVALRRIAPRLSLLAWFGAAIASGLIWLACYFATDHSPLLRTFKRALFDPARGFEGAAFQARADGTFTLVEFLSLPWHLLLIGALTITVTLYAVPVLLLSRRSGYRFAVLLAAAAAGAFAAIAGEAIYAVLGSGFRWGRDSLNGVSWAARFDELWLRAAFGALGGAVSGLALGAMTRRHAAAGLHSSRWLADIASRAGLTLMTLATLSIAIAPSTVTYVAGPNGARAGFPAIRKAFTLAPGVDASTGRRVLAFSHQSEISLHPYPVASFAPDGKSLAIRTADNMIQHIDAATGKKIGQFSGVMAPFESFDQTWSPDSRYYVLRSSGDEYPEPNSHYKPRAARVRIFSASDHRAITEWQSKPFECRDSDAAPSMILAPDGESIWVLCAPPQGPAVSGESAIQLSFPALARIGQSPKRTESRGAVLYHGRPASWQLGHTNDSTLRVTDLATGDELLALDGLGTPDRGAAMTFQPHASQVSSDHVVLKYCGFPTGGIPETEREKIMAAINRCRYITFDPKTKALIAARETSRLDYSRLASADIGGRKLTFATSNSSASKTGALVVRDAETDEEVQRVTTTAQGIVGLTPDNVWLVTVEESSRRMRFYRVGL